MATTFAICREAFNASVSLPSIRFLPRNLRTPTAGPVALILANIVVLVSLCFYGFETTKWANFENIGYRTGFVSIAQLPLLFLLAGKNNIIGFLTGMSHERLNWLHRWCARCLFLTSTIHFGYWLADWWPFGDFVGDKIRTDPITTRGMIAWAFLAWIVFSSVAPIRGWSYEVFVLQHLVSFAVFIGFVYVHTPAEVHVYIWIPVGLFFFDRIVRGLYVLYTNISFFHPKQRQSGDMKGLWACRATFTPVSHETTKITIKNPPITWSAGQHVFLSCHSIIPLQSHPFTIASIPSDGKMEFFVKAEKGGTRRFFRHAEKTSLSLPTEEQEGELQVGDDKTKSVAIEGPFGRIRPLRQFDSVILFAGSTGATYTVPLLRDLVAAWLSGAPVVTRHIRFVWVVKSRGQVSWFASQLCAVTEDLLTLRSQGKDFKVEMSIYVTCDESFTEEHKTLLKSWQSEPPHGKVEEVSRNEAAADETAEKKLGFFGETTNLREVDSRRLSEANNIEEEKKAGGCGPDGTCCCTGTIEDEDAITSRNAASCSCCGGSKSPSQPTEKNQTTSAANLTPPKSQTTNSNPRNSSSASSSSAPSPKTGSFILNPRIAVFAGRPQCRNIIRKSLEQALGESAVIACGPAGLVDGVRASAVALSDERAVHKGTGAQGIYLHTEAFSY